MSDESKVAADQVRAAARAVKSLQWAISRALPTLMQAADALEKDDGDGR